MKLADELFQSYFPIEENLLAYGFTKEGDRFLCKKPIRGGEFDLVLSIKDQSLSAVLVDADFGDEYRRIDAEEEVGTFVAELRDECEALLLDLRARCFRKDYFTTLQANRITALIETAYGALPEFLWDDSPDCGIFRNKESGKWFGIIMYVAKDRLIPKTTGKVDVMNLKLDEFVEKAQTKAGVYPAYHMNKTYWVSVILDETLSDDEIMKLIALSFAHSEKKSKKK
ncbi:MAG: MmcQ/YjbR family DNA-binding protein [Clostridia bacterium]|nr:MmcQ/YjbR family DNA-binding protein [Clostridia bacterium]